MRDQLLTIEDLPPPVRSLTPAGVTGPVRTSSFLGVPPNWPVDEFAIYLRGLMTEAGIPDFAELSRVAGVSQTQFSNWRQGKAQPSRESLKRIAPVLKVSPVKLFIAAGIDNADELDLVGEVDLRIVPAEIRALIELYEDPRLSDEQRSYVRRIVADVSAGLRAELAKSQIRPPGRRKAG